MKRLTGRSRHDKHNIFYVVTRDGRRAWPKDYWTLPEAQAHSNALVKALKQFNDPGYKRVAIVETVNPEEID